jgi:biopolymer transport protein ExbD
MAQIDNSCRGKNSRYKVHKIRKIPSVDFTPMVDLAFLLITFFMLTTTMLKPFNMILHMPEENGEPEKIPSYRSLTIIADKENSLWYYNGEDPSEIKQTAFSTEGLRNLLYENNARVRDHSSGKYELICLIKLTDGANYQNLIDLLDEMVITDIDTYALQDVTDLEKEQILNLENK